MSILDTLGMSPDAPDKDRIRGSVFTLSPYKALT